MKKLELIFAAILVPLDYLALLLAATFAYFLRFESFVREIRPVVFELEYRQFFKIAAVVCITWLIVFALNGLYTIKRHSLIRDFSRIIVACSAATLLIVVAFFFNFQLFSSRLIIITSWLLSIIFVIIERAIVHYIKKIFYKKGIGVRQIVVIGNNKNAQEIIAEFKAKPSYGFKVLKNLADFSESAQTSLISLISQRQLDDVILADPTLVNEQKDRLIDFCVDNQLNYKYAASLTETKLINFDLSTVAGVPLIEVKQTRLDGWGRIIKRTFDLFFSIILIIILSPVWLIIGLLIKATSVGPIFVKLERVGANGQKFRLYKFRSMIKNAHQLKPVLMEQNERNDGPLFKMENDPRITNFGKFIRRWSFDELPQLFNVFMGQMSLVGPRPHEPEEVARYQVSDKKLLTVKPGMTGMAQVTGRSDLSWDEEVRLDTYYLENWSLGLDVQIILKTPKAVFSRQGAV